MPSARYLDDHFHLQKAVLAFLGHDESFAKQKDVSFAPSADNTEHILPSTEPTVVANLKISASEWWRNDDKLRSCHEYNIYHANAI